MILPQPLSAEVSARIVHDKRALLRHINIYAEMSKELAAGSQELRDNMDRISAKTAALARLVDADRLLQVLQTGGVAVSPVSLRAVVDDGLRKAQKNWGSIMPTVKGQATVAGIAPHLSIAVQELVANSQEHAQAGPVTLSVSEGPQPCLTVTSPSDTPADPSLFEAYAVGSGQKRPGAGLGLFLVRQIAAAHGGSLEALDADDRTFALRMTLPAAHT